MGLLADQDQVAELVGKLANQIAQDLNPMGGGNGWVIVGIRSRGDVLAQRLAQKLHPDHVGTLDITLYRDDLSEIGPQPIVRTTEIDFSIDKVGVVLVDDVLMTGRSIRAALQSLMDLGRPRRVWLSVLVDRGGRELPIAPDHVALDLSGTCQPGIGSGERVDVYLSPTDPCDQIVVRSGEE